ncbi:MAG: class I SAM-dependent methyltransferase [Chloroflexi bacterium]|nr:class I SAM-dependent methyltransferase [Chloroflexota bacterium]
MFCYDDSVVFGKSYFEKVFERQSPWSYVASTYEKGKYERQLQAIRDYAPEPRDILEIGCAEGDYTAMLARAFPESQILGVDISRTALERAERNCRSYPNVSFMEMDIIQTLRRDELPRQAFSVIIQSESLYYLFPALVLRRYVGGYFRDLAGHASEGAIFLTCNGINAVTRLVMECYYRALKRHSRQLHRAGYREWNDYRRRFTGYDMRVFRFTPEERR